MYIYTRGLLGPSVHKCPAYMGPARKGPGGPQQPRGAHKGPPHKGPARKGPVGPTRAQGDPQGPGPQGPRGANKGLSRHIPRHAEALA